MRTAEHWDEYRAAAERVTFVPKTYLHFLGVMHPTTPVADPSAVEARKLARSLERCLQESGFQTESLETPAIPDPENVESSNQLYYECGIQMLDDTSLIAVVHAQGYGMHVLQGLDERKELIIPAPLRIGATINLRPEERARRVLKALWPHVAQLHAAPVSDDFRKADGGYVLRKRPGKLEEMGQRMLRTYGVRAKPVFLQR